MGQIIRDLQQQADQPLAGGTAQKKDPKQDYPVGAFAMMISLKKYNQGLFRFNRYFKFTLDYL
ncbi:MAG: hypothetical protein LBT47_10400 [Deltaproteobacteria bacterium]|jgi:hypothetical protein|nr:hypothetical protein [Deltaproteobacteria bacterium]